MDNPTYFHDKNILVFKQNISWQGLRLWLQYIKTRNEDETTFAMSDTTDKEKH